MTLPTDSGSICRKYRPRFNAAGFTLLEIMVALAIIGIGSGVVFQGIGQGLRLRGTSAEKVRMALIAESVLGGLPERATAPDSPESGEDDGFRWRLETVGVAHVAGAAGTVGSTNRTEAVLLEMRLTVIAPSGMNWEMSTLLPRDAGASP